MRIHHVGMVVANIESTVEYLKAMGGGVRTPVYEDPNQKSYVQFVNLGGLTIELLSPMSEDSPVAQSVKTRRRLHHLCYEVEHFDKELAKWDSEGRKIVSKPKSAKAFQGRRVAFFMTKEGDLFELLEAEK